MGKRNFKKGKKGGKKNNGERSAKRVSKIIIYFFCTSLKKLLVQLINI